MYCLLIVTANVYAQSPQTLLEESTSSLWQVSQDFDTVELWDNKISYNIWFANTLPEGRVLAEAQFYFEEEFDWQLLVSLPIEQDYNSKRMKYEVVSIPLKGIWLQKVYVPYKSDSTVYVDGTKQLQTIKNFTLVDKNKNKKLLSLKSFAYTNLWILTRESVSWSLANSSFVKTETLDYSLRSIQDYAWWIVMPSDVTNAEQELIETYTFLWWSMFVSPDTFKKMYGSLELNASLKDTYEWYDPTRKCPSAYDFGIWKIYVINDTTQYTDINCYSMFPQMWFYENDEKQLLVDSVVASSFLDYRIIIAFMIFFFLTVVCVFIFSKYLRQKMKETPKLMLLYTLPSVSFLFVCIFSIANLLVKWITPIQNTVEIQHFKDWKVQQIITKWVFSPQWWLYAMTIPLDSVWNRYKQISPSVFKETSYMNQYEMWMVTDDYKNFLYNFPVTKPSSLVYGSYMRVKEPSNIPTEYTQEYTLEFKNDVNTKTYRDFACEYLRKCGSDFEDYVVGYFAEIKRIAVTKTPSDEFYKTYWFDVKDNNFIRIDLYY